MSVKDYVSQELEDLDDVQLQQVAKYIALLKRRTDLAASTTGGEDQVAALYREFADEDRMLAEAGMADYAGGLAAEDIR